MPKSRKIRTEKGNLEILGNIEADTIKQTDMKEKIKERISGERENNLKRN